MNGMHLNDFLGSLDESAGEAPIYLFVESADGRSRLKKAYFITDSSGDDFFLLTDKDIMKEVNKCEDADAAVE